MLATVAPLTLALLAAELPDANTGAPPATTEAAASPVAGLRQRPSTVAPKRGIHELKDPGGWPAEPPTVAGPIDAARFLSAYVLPPDATVTFGIAKAEKRQRLPR